MNDDLLYQSLLENQRFISWVLNGSKPDDEFWHRWKLDNPQHTEILEQARLTVRAIHGAKTGMTDEQVDARAHAILAHAKSREGKFRPLWMAWRPWAAAASVLLLVAFGWAAYQNNHVANLLAGQEQHWGIADGEEAVHVTNTGKSLRHIRLSDGSSVVLYQHSSIRYPRHFLSGRRFVELTGDAFFEVAKDSLRPFFVRSGGLVTRVVGTSFSIRSGSEGVTVAVKTGKVAVFPEGKALPAANVKPKDAVLLMPQEQATLQKAGTQIIKVPNQSNTLLNIPIETQSFEYNHTPIAQVFASIENAYGVKIHFDRKLMEHCSLTATLGDEPLETKLEWIGAILEATYTISDQDITISAKSCN
ncbi:FecR family protein [Dyadobacter fermentans]|uniref:Anti-FecI sigma factor, FecR n=1 Tax=Dyadobacter fermentans (strain ATCC 700827 / DSM 18053 / CIP 107007 / KCTC 52180 / NS114) TaxID=471854 RepID=C6VUU6_DYAFD|nr:FecR family protein [Dyadobacter fermentans]ACT93083.1 anti-FecI sigma factor, FecR [Dyadobacter fermentans DSM 18053]